MKTVIPTTLTWIFSHLIHWIGFFIALSAVGAFTLYILPFFEVDFIPTVDRNPFFTLPRLDVSTPTDEKLGFNTLLILLFWLQHSIMSRTWFKQLMVKIFSD